MKHSVLPTLTTRQQMVRLPEGCEKQAIFIADRPHRVFAQHFNRGGVPILLDVTGRDAATPERRTIAPGSVLMEEFVGVTQIAIAARNGFERAGVLLEGLQFAVFEPNDRQLWSILDELPDACFQGDITRVPDSIEDCLWVRDKLWRFPEPRRLELEIEVFGDQDMRVTLEQKDGLETHFTLFASSSFSVHRRVKETFEDVAAIFVEGRRNPAKACSALRYHFRFCVPRRIGLTI